MKSPKKPAPKAATASGKHREKERGPWCPRSFFYILVLLAITGFGLALSASEPHQEKQVDLLETILPEGFPRPVVPKSNPLSAEKIDLGRHLFYEKRLAVDGKTSCASCHVQSLAFTDGKPRGIGATGETHPRATMSLVNSAYHASLTWADPGQRELETQALVPLFNQHPVEMGLTGRLDHVLAMLKADKQYQTLFQKAFPEEPGPNLLQITKALASFQRTIVSFSSTFDSIVFDDAQPPEREAIMRGFSLFFSETFSCGKCHGGFNFSGPVTLEETPSFPTFHHNGLLGQGPEQDERTMDPGLARHSGHPRDWGKFRAPSLRNIAQTAPYMHDGSLKSLEDVLDHYAQGGQPTPYKGTPGKNHPNKSPFVKGFSMSSSQKQDLLTFLRSLTDHRLLTREDLSDPNPSPAGSE